MRRRTFIKALFLTAALVTLAPAANAAVKVSGLETGSYPSIKVNVVTSKRTATAPLLLENGMRVTLSSAQNLGRAKSVVLAVDRSQSMKGKPLADAAAAARSFILAKPPGDRIAIATFAT